MTEAIQARAICGATAADCRCHKDPGHEQAGDPNHGCDPKTCTGEWTGIYDPTRWAGGPGWEPITMPRKVVS